MRKLAEKVLYAGRWLVLKKLHLQGNEGEQFEWEYISRRDHARGIVMVARMVPSGRIVFLKQFRPAINNFIIGFPAGLARMGDIGTEALRELEEETGFKGRVTEISPPLKSNPALIDETVYLVHVSIDDADYAEQMPQQKLESSEEIEVLLIEEDQVGSFLQEQHRKGLEIGIGPWYIFMGQTNFPDLL